MQTFIPAIILIVSAMLIFGGAFREWHLCKNGLLITGVGAITLIYGMYSFDVSPIAVGTIGITITFLSILWKVIIEENQKLFLVTGVIITTFAVYDTPAIMSTIMLTVGIVILFGGLLLDWTLDKVSYIAIGIGTILLVLHIILFDTPPYTVLAVGGALIFGSLAWELLTGDSQVEYMFVGAFILVVFLNINI